MENYDLFSDDLGRGIPDGLPGVVETQETHLLPELDLKHLQPISCKKL
jgi:hypothetical protein